MTLINCPECSRQVSDKAEVLKAESCVVMVTALES